MPEATQKKFATFILTFLNLLWKKMGCGSSSKIVEVTTVPVRSTAHGNQGRVPKIDKKSPEYIIAAFAEFDLNGDGIISMQEVRLAFIKMNIPHNDQVIVQFMREVDIDGDGQINIREFAIWWIKENMEPPPPTLEMLVAMFHEIDKDGKGFITASDLKLLMLEVKGFYTEGNIASIVRAADVNRDGVISLQEFVQLMAKLISQ